MRFRIYRSKPVRFVIRKAKHIHRNEEHEVTVNGVDLRANRCADCGIWTKVHKRQAPQVANSQRKSGITIRKRYIPPMGKCHWCKSHKPVKDSHVPPDDCKMIQVGGVLTPVDPYGDIWTSPKVCADCVDPWGFPPPPKRYRIVRRVPVTKPAPRKVLVIRRKP